MSDIDFELKVELIIERVLKQLIKYLHKRHPDNYRKHSDAFDKYVEKDNLMNRITQVIQDLTKLGSHEILEPMRQQIDMLEAELGRVKELILKSFNQQDVIVRTSSEIEQEPPIVTSQQVDKFKKKLQNQQNMINLLLENQAQMKQHQSQPQPIVQVNTDEIYQKLLSQVEGRINALKKEVTDSISEQLKQIKEKSNVSWVVLSELMNKLDDHLKMHEEEVTNVDQHAPKRGLFKKAVSLIYKK